MAFNLPPPWDPGYALPENVIDEGLQRRGFVTKQMPRGTYDAPNVGTGGYVVPQYVMQEGYGQGTFTTKWEPGGQYDGPRVPHWLNQRPQVTADRRIGRREQKITFRRSSAMGDDAAPGGGHPLFTAYGQRAAHAILSRVSMLPPSQRDAALRQILGSIDKTLYGRANGYTQELVRAGVRGPDAAFQGLARAMSTGIASEIVRLGKTRVAPQPSSLLGLGMYQSMGAAPALSILATIAPPQAVICKGYSWVVDHWERTRAGASDVPGPAGGCPSTSAPVTVTGDVASVGKLPKVPVIQVGGLMIPERFLMDKPEAFGDQKAYMLASPASLSAEAKSWVHAELLKGSGLRKLSDIKTSSGVAKYAPWLAAFGISPTTPFDCRKILDSCWIGDPNRLSGNQALPIAKFKHPVTGEDVGLYMYLGVAHAGSAVTDAGGTNPVVLRIWVSKIYQPANLFGAIWDGIKSLVAVIVDLAEDALKAVGSLACDVLNQPGAVSAGAAAGGGAGAAGVGIAQSTLCKPGDPPPPPPGTTAAGGNSILPLAIAGGAVLAAVLLLSKKKTKATP